MNITAYHIASDQIKEIQSKVSTLDELTRSLPRGFYTTFNTLSGGTRVLGLQDHLNRLYGPAKEAGIHPSASEEQLRKRITEVVKQYLPSEARVRIVLAKDDGSIYVGVQPFAPLPQEVYARGVHVVTTELVRHDPVIKDTGFISESARQRKLVNTEVFEVLLTKNGRIFEGMTSNFYAILDNRIITAKSGILLGVTRKSVLSLAKGEGMSIEYRSPRLEEKFHETFLTSSSRGVVPIVLIDNVKVGKGSVGVWTKRLMGAYQAYVKARSESLV